MFKFGITCCLMGILIIDGMAVDFRSHPNWPKQMEDICGESNSDRIIGGSYATIGQFPWMARLVFQVNDQYAIDCGGSLITEQFVLSAAHCLMGTGKLEFVLLGEYDDTKDLDCKDAGLCAESVQLIQVEKILMPAIFNRSSLTNDIILIKLKKPARFNDWVMPICLPTGHQHLGEFAEVAGWGLYENDGNTSSILKYVRLPIVPMSECRKHLYVPTNALGQICAGNENMEDSCGGDSGGPLMQVLNSEYGPRYYLLGIVSYGHRICGISPAVYTNVTSYMPLILNGLH